ncbi:efflux transporter outer membrane subunit [Roseateles violae]|uniref:Efflux transporter outer membrane subunit n=1 Tax=Roseateles violae TaxID=3058042 RepID=A0ABT8DYG6_9BURK|nr:efflux transporter outer membrane subunit [Pelomonas sp. PFR6]MDN3922576.1 efflux transporter outer membrane subunit [Pelomonas sp. PFR6]
MKTITIKQKITALTAAAGALLLAGCVNLAPEHQRPAAPVAADWPAPAASTGQAAAELSWQNFYAGDARLRELIGLALRNNRDLRTALLNVEQARALARVADANRYPTVGVGFTSSRTPGAKDTINSSYQAGLQVAAYELDLFGKLRNYSDAAAARYLATAEGSRAAQIALVAGVASTHLALQADTEMLELSRQTVESREDSLRLIRLKYDAGSASLLDLNSAESAAAGARATLAQNQRQRAQDENALVLLIGQPLPADLPPGRPLAAQALPDVPAGLPSEVLVGRPDVLQAEQQLIAANANIGAARAAFFPSISLTASAGTASTQLSELFSNTVWSFGSQILLPIFDAGRNQANLDAARAAQGAAVAQYEKAVQTAFREVADALAGRATFGEQLRAQAELARAENERLRLIELRYQQGVSNSLDLRDAQRSAFLAQQALVQVRLAQLLNSVQLYKALGGGLVEANGKG